MNQYLDDSDSQTPLLDLAAHFAIDVHSCSALLHVQVTDAWGETQGNWKLKQTNKKNLETIDSLLNVSNIFFKMVSVISWKYNSLMMKNVNVLYFF